MRRKSLKRTLGTSGLGAALLLGAGLSLGGCGGIVDDKAEAQFKAQAGELTMTLYPALVRRGEQVSYDAGAAREIAKFLNDAGLATAEVNTAEVPIATEWGMNESRMFRDSVHHFQDWLAEHPVTTEYAALPEYLLSPTGKVMGVHFYVLAADGTPSYGIAQNSHHDAFQRVNPKDVADCTRIVEDVLASDLKRQE